MVGNGILAFGVIFVVVIFSYMGLKASREKQPEKSYQEMYEITLAKGFSGSSVSVYVNDSLLLNSTITEEPTTIEVGRFADECAVFIVDNETEAASIFNLSEKGGAYSFVKDADGIKLLNSQQ